MTRDVLLKISGFQCEPGQQGEQIALITPASYFRKEDSHYLLYEELPEGEKEKVRNKIRFDKESVEIVKTGLVSARMTFENGHRNMTFYSTPYGSFSMGVEAREISLKEEEQEIRVNLKYRLDIENQIMSDCNLQMEVFSRNSGEFRLAD